ncbi:MAG: hypothetical protein AB7O67_18440 [Vicinamibacterales bacterium]
MLVACDAIPSDPAGTLASVRDRHEVRAGLVAGESAADEARMEDVARAIARDTGVDLDLTEASAAHLVEALDAGRIDVVVETGTPWKSRVALTPPLHPAEGGESAVRVAVRRGENRWLTRVSEVVRHEARP